MANQRQAGDAAEYAAEAAHVRTADPVPHRTDILFLEIDLSTFSDVLRVKGVEVDGYRVLRAGSSAMPNAIVAVLLALRDSTSVLPPCHAERTDRRAMPQQRRTICTRIPRSVEHHTDPRHQVFPHSVPRRRRTAR